MTPSESELITCYHCNQPGHLRQDCPQRQGSQGHGTPQSQSSVGHAHMQYFPFHPGAGQRNQYQSQGATQAPYATQTSQRSQRGQSMGRGREQSSQTGTLGTKGRVYVIVPSTEPADQPTLQGMFLLSRLWARILFDSGASHSFIVASCVRELGLEVETLEEPMHVSSP